MFGREASNGKRGSSVQGHGAQMRRCQGAEPGAGRSAATGTSRSGESRGSLRRPAGIRTVAWVGLVALVLLFCGHPAWAFDRPRLRGAPSIEVGYGIGDPSLEDLGPDFARLGSAELNVGYVSLRRARGSIKSYESGGVIITRLGSDLGDSAGADELDPELWRFGFRWSRGYAYKVRGSHAILFHGSGIHVAHFDVPGLGDNAADSDLLADDLDQHLLGYFDEEFTIGTSTTGGVLLQFGPVVGLEAGYERSIACRRLLLWKWAASGALEHGALGLIDEFVDKILDRRPAAAPIVSFILKNGLSYAAYELRRDDMNYPFDDAPPLFTESYKVGLRFTF